MIENKILPTARSHLTIQNSPFKIHHSKFTIRNSPFEIHHSKFKIQNSKFPPALPSLSHSKSKIQHLFLLLLLPIQNSKSFSTSPSSHSKFKIQNSKFSPRSHASDKDLRPGEFYAVRDVSFTLRRSECLGLLKPDAGRIEMHGRIGALIALGAGFNPILNACGNRQIPSLIFTS